MNPANFYNMDKDTQQNIYPKAFSMYYEQDPDETPEVHVNSAKNTPKEQLSTTDKIILTGVILCVILGAIQLILSNSGLENGIEYMDNVPIDSNITNLT